jgi:hypothetical protein
MSDILFRQYGELKESMIKYIKKNEICDNMKKKPEREDI